MHNCTKKFKKTLTSLAMLSSLLTLGACAGTPDALPKTLESSVVKINKDAISATLSCNHMSGAYQLDDQQRLVVKNLVQTRKACLGQAMDDDAHLAAFLQSKPTLIQEGEASYLSGSGLKVPVRMEDATEGEGVSKLIYVQGDLVACEGGAGKQMCLRVRENEEDEWRNYYGRIEGFNPLPGHYYRLRVKEYKRATNNAGINELAQDVNQKRWVLDLVVRQMPVK